MTRIAYLLLCHRDPDAVIAQARQLSAAGDCVAVHYDASAPRADARRVAAAFGSDPRVTMARPVRCGWGEWSLVQASMNAARAALAAFPDATHFYLISGDCMPIKSAGFIRRVLAEANADHIEAHDFHDTDWIKTGLRDERLIYRHWFNERRQPRLFYASLAVQSRLGLVRRVPDDLRVMIGSQWWCLRRRTLEAVLDFAEARRDVRRFFATSWIPDETFFQTLVPHLVPRAEIRFRRPTFLLFSDYGLPVAFHNDHFEMLAAQDYLFARKISPEAHRLKARLGALFAGDRMDFGRSDGGERIYAFLAGRGRIGRRFAPRAWEAGGTIGRDRTLFVLTCKKWHVAKRLLDRIRQSTNLPGIAYLFDEEETELPDLGGIEGTLAKRSRHRRAVLRLLFEHFETDRLAICIDPARFDAIEDFHADRCETRLLDVSCTFSDAFLEGHACRVGLAGEGTPAEAMRHLLPTIRQDIAFEAERIRDAGFPHHYRIGETAAADANADALAGFLKVSYDQARRIADEPHLFAD